MTLQWRALSLALVSALFGGAVTRMQEPMIDRALQDIAELHCPAQRWLATGKERRNEAISQGRLDWQAEATAAFKQARDCGSSEGLFYWAHAYCREGWGLAYNPPMGRQLMREAAQKNNYLALLLLDGDWCDHGRKLEKSTRK